MKYKMYHPPSRRQQLIQRIAVYSLMTVTVIGLVIVLVFVMLGYRFNRADGQIEQGGLVQFDTKPSGATVSIDSTDFGTRTPAKSTLAAGQHFITMRRSGYEPWQKSVDVVAGSVLWLNYARLIPQELTPTNVANFPTVTSTSASPDDKWIAIIDESDVPAVRLADLTRDEVKMTTLELPSTSYTHPAAGKPQAFTVSAWDPTSRYILLKHSYDGSKIEWIVVDREDVAATRNVTTLLDIKASKLVFSNSDSRVMYAQINHDVRKLDLDSATLSRPLVQDVAEFSLYDRSTITYVTLLDSKTKQRSVGYYNDGANKARVIRRYNDDSKLPLHLSIGKYFGDAYVAIAYGDNVEILRGTLPSSDSSEASSLDIVATMTVPGGASYLSTKTNGRFIVAQHGNAFVVYDLELKKMTTTKLKGKAKVTRELHWLDGYTVWSDQDNELRLYEFDGANQHDIMPVAPGFSVTLSPSGKYLYGITKAKDGTYHLTRVQLQLT